MIPKPTQREIIDVIINTTVNEIFASTPEQQDAVHVFKENVTRNLEKYFNTNENKNI